MNAVLALDISLVSTGWVVVDAAAQPEPLLAHGCIKTAPDRQNRLKGVDDITRVSGMVSQLNSIIAEHRPSLIVGELPYGSQSASSCKAQGICLGVFAALRVYHAIPCQWVTPQSSKKAVCGRKDASKEAVQAVVLQVWPDIAMLGGKPTADSKLEHIADALAAIVSARDSDLYRMVAQQAQQQAIRGDGQAVMAV